MVEDDPVYRELLILALGSEGYRAVGAENGSLALEVLKEMEPAVILLDLVMPVLDGLSFLHVLKEESRVNAPVIVVTCLENRSAVVDSLVAGASDVLVKPVNLDDLLGKIEGVLRTMPAVESRDSGAAASGEFRGGAI